MKQYFKHTFFNYFLLILISVKVVHFIADNFISTYDIEMCCEIDADDFENESEDKKEFDETEKIHQLSYFGNVINESVSKFKHISLSENYLTRYLEFTTPPPELA